MASEKPSRCFLGKHGRAIPLELQRMALPARCSADRWTLVCTDSRLVVSGSRARSGSTPRRSLRLRLVRAESALAAKPSSRAVVMHAGADHSFRRAVAGDAPAISEL